MRRFGVLLVAVVLLGACTRGGEPSRSDTSMIHSPTTLPAEGTVLVPNLEGVSLPDARRTLSALGLRLGKIRVISGTYVPSAITKQRPIPGRQVALGAKVRVLIGPQSG